MSDNVFILSARRVTAIFNDCVDPSPHWHISDRSISDARFDLPKLKGYSAEISAMLKQLSNETRLGSTWRAFMFNTDEQQWAYPLDAMLLIALARALGFVSNYSDDANFASRMPLAELPAYRVEL